MVTSRNIFSRFSWGLCLFIFGLSQVFSPPYQFSRYDNPLNLRGAFVYLIDFSVSHQFLHRIFGVESVPAENLNRICCVLIRQICGETFRYRGLVSVFDTVIGFPSRFHPSQPRVFHANRHVSQHESYGLVICDVRTERLPFQGIFQSFVQATAG